MTTSQARGIKQDVLNDASVAEGDVGQCRQEPAVGTATAVEVALVDAQSDHWDVGGLVDGADELQEPTRASERAESVGNPRSGFVRSVGHGGLPETVGSPPLGECFAPYGRRAPQSTGREPETTGRSAPSGYPRGATPGIAST